jgi:hypothetical protein
VARGKILARANASYDEDWLIRDLPPHALRNDQSSIFHFFG